ncbi:MAG TPA: DUF2059 domain-containing protein, partial [Pseudomonadota bacterium]|nr:DUF2059 domain-containing protein [Pseudomonadota bacterium]
RASLPSMPEQIRQLFTREVSVKLSDQQLAAVTAAAEHGFRIDVFETPALSALAQNLDAASVTKSEAFLGSDLGKRMVSADVEAAYLGHDKIDKIMEGELSVPSTPKRDALIDQLERATHSAESTAQVFLSMSRSVAVGTAIGSGQDPAAVGERAAKSAEASNAELQTEMRVPMRRFLAYAYRDLSDAELKHLVSFLESPAGKRYVAAYNASMEAGFEAMGKRTGEQLGESLRELAQAKADEQPANQTPPGIAAPAPPAPPAAPAAPAAPVNPAASPVQPQ